MAEIPAWPVELWTPKGWTNATVRRVPLDRLKNEVTAAWPWPYSDEQLETIGSMIPENARQHALKHIVSIGRRAVFELKLRGGYPDAKPEKDETDAKPKKSKKPNLKAEIDRLKAAVVEITEAAKSMSPDAWRHVAKKAGAHSPFRSMASAMAVIFELRAEDLHSGDAPGASGGKAAL